MVPNRWRYNFDPGKPLSFPEPGGAVDATVIDDLHLHRVARDFDITGSWAKSVSRPIEFSANLARRLGSKKL